MHPRSQRAHLRLDYYGSFHVLYYIHSVYNVHSTLYTPAHSQIKLMSLILLCSLWLECGKTFDSLKVGSRRARTMLAQSRE